MARGVRIKSLRFRAMQRHCDLPNEILIHRVLIAVLARWALRARDVRPALRESAIARKSDGSFVTAVDVALQTLTIESLVRHDEAPILAEESTDSLAAIPGGIAVVMDILRSIEPSSRIRPQDLEALITRNPARGTEERFWILDPIDGTRSFVRGGHWCVCLALAERGRVEFAVNALPTVGSGVVQVATRGHGSFEGSLASLEEAPWRRLRVEEHAKSSVRIASAPKSSAAWKSRVMDAATRAELEVEWIDAESQAKYAFVARDEADLVLTPQSQGGAALWDHAGGALIAEEAGLCVQSFDGTPIAWNAGRDVRMGGGLAVGSVEGVRLARAIAPPVSEHAS